MKRVLALAAGAAAAYPPAALAAAWAYGTRSLNRPVPEGAVIAVMGTAQYDGVPSKQFAARLEEAAAAHRESGARIVTLGGRLPGDRFTEAGAGRAWLVAHGVAEDRIDELPAGNDTAGSLRVLAGSKWGSAPVLIVTDPLHALRSVRVARALGIDAAARGAAAAPTRFPRRRWWLTAYHEAGGLIVRDVEAFLGAPAARALERGLRALDGWVRPSRRARIAVLSTGEDERGEAAGTRGETAGG